MPPHYSISDVGSGAEVNARHHLPHWHHWVVTLVLLDSRSMGRMPCFNIYSLYYLGEFIVFFLILGSPHAAIMVFSWEDTLPT